MSEEPAIDMNDLGVIMEGLSPSSLAAHIDADRPYDGQQHTDQGARGAQMVEGLTMRDIRDCFIRACYESSGLPIEEWPGSVYDLPWSGTYGIDSSKVSASVLGTYSRLLQYGYVNGLI